MDNFVQTVEEHHGVVFYLFFFLTFFKFFFFFKQGTVETIKAHCTAVANPVP